MASVISSSPRAEGRIALTASKIAESNMYTPTRARFEGGTFGFSISRTTWPPESSATPNWFGFGTAARRIWLLGLSSRNRVTSGASRSRIRLSPRYMQNESAPRKSSDTRTAWARPSGASCGMYVTETPKRLPSPTASMISWRVSPTTMPISLIPDSASASIP